MSVKLPLQAIFSHLYPVTEPDASPSAEALIPPGTRLEQESGLGAEATEGSATKLAPPKQPPDQYAARVSKIDGDLQATISHSQDTAHHLVTARKLALSAEIATAKQLDLDHGLEERKTGLPIGDSLLEVDADMLGAHGLLHAKELLQQGKVIACCC